MGGETTRGEDRDLTTWDHLGGNDLDVHLMCSPKVLLVIKLLVQTPLQQYREKREKQEVVEK